MDFNYFRKYRYDKLEEMAKLEEYDCLISSYVEADRVKKTSMKIPSKAKWWVCGNGEIPSFIKETARYEIREDSDGGITQALLDTNCKKLCIDITGFEIPKLLLLIRFLLFRGIKKFDAIYTEPNQYKEDEDTKFSETLCDVRLVTGYAGPNTSETRNDLLVIAAGYDHSRIIDVANDKKGAQKVLLFGFPPSSPGMFQENILRAHLAETAVGEDCFKNMDLNIFAPANDPFSTAQALKDYFSHTRKEAFTNVYFSPLSSKPQALGMALFYLWEKGNIKPWSIIYPFCSHYIADTTTTISRIWRYEVELP